MNYNNVLNCEETAFGVESLSAMMDRACNISADILTMAYRINSHMFGMGEPVDSEKRPSPNCFRDVMGAHVDTLSKVADELSKISNLLGV